MVIILGVNGINRVTPHIPYNNGRWQDDGKPGNSVWFPDLSYIPQGSNEPYSPMTFRQLILLNYKKPLSLAGISTVNKMAVKANLLLLANGAKGVEFRNNEPNFSPFAIATVKVDGFPYTRYGSNGTMPNADKILAGRLGLEESAVRQWINDNQYVWHERQDGKHIDLLCHDIHGNIPHSGGISANKARRKRS